MSFDCTDAQFATRCAACLLTTIDSGGSATGPWTQLGNGATSSGERGCLSMGNFASANVDYQLPAPTSAFYRYGIGVAAGLVDGSCPAFYNRTGYIVLQPQ